MADVEFKQENGVLWITLNRPERMGAMSNDMRAEILERLRAARTDLEIRAVVLTGTGKGFCSGADLSRSSADGPPWAGAAREMMRESHMNPEESWQATLDLGAAASLGVHYGTFDLSDEPSDEPSRRFRSAAADRSDDAWVLAVGETRRF